MEHGKTMGASISRLLLAGTLFLCAWGRLGAQDFGLGATASTNVAAVNSTLTFTVNVTNLTSFQLANVLVTNTFVGSASVRLLSFAPTTITVLTNANTAIYVLDVLPPGGAAQVVTTLRPTSSGIISNLIVVAPTTITNRASTNVVVTVQPPASDLAISVTSPSGGVLVNDQINYGIRVTNQGSTTATSVQITNADFSAFQLLSVVPGNQAYSLTNGTLTMNLGSLAGGAATNLQLKLQPTNAGLWGLTSSVFAASITDSDLTNNTATASITVGELIAGELVAANLTSMVYDPQTGLMKQTVRVTNTGTNTYGAARLIVSGLTNQLYNAVGTNGGNPYVVYAGQLAPGQSVDLVLEYFVPTRLPINVPDSAYAAYGTTALNLQVDPGQPPNITGITNLGSYGFLVEFEAIQGRSYSVLYSDDMFSSTTYIAQPPIVAPGSRVQWIDNGPPKTISHPATNTSRLYRVRLNP
jgi:hypothetical protein